MMIEESMHFFPTLAESVTLIHQYGYAVVLILSVPEGPIVGVLAGFFVSLGYLNAVISFFVLLAGDLIGDALYYALGRFGGHHFIRRWGKYFAITEERVARFQKQFLKHDWKIVLFSKTQALGSAILFSAGFVRMPFSRYIAYNTLGTVPKVILFEVVGIYFGQGYRTINTYIGYVAIGSFFVGFLLLGFYWWAKRSFTLGEE